MSREKKIFEKFPQNWPKQPFAERVVGERGQPTAFRKGGGENMDLERHYEHKQHAFDSFCKKVLRCEAFHAYRAIGRRQNRFVSLGDLAEEADEQLASYDVYPWEYTPFPLDGDVILIRDDRLAGALNAMPQDGRNILLMYWFLEMAGREIGEKLSLPRQTVNNRRLRAYAMLKELMGGEANE